MTTFPSGSCSVCGQAVQFDNRECINCGHLLGFVPERMAMEPPHRASLSSRRRSAGFHQ
ncbi:hypothetical protein HJB84_27155 [Rhizobium sp. NZLR1b]|uniref:zinc-ribbon domain-containing protein n=1 Tax=unclassified Rhizobium TaxID=2613769 RepID=UPI001C83DD19|nr:hypothetical protein [Rhizobium sp. NZLR1b]MBX5192710.1 hypothetical protein [Rhizobium sp. NZLR3b]